MNSPIQNIKKPSKSVGKGEPPAQATIHNLHKPTSTGHVQLQFQVPPEIRRAVKTYAAENDTRMSELFVRMWDTFKRQNP